MELIDRQEVIKAIDDVLMEDEQYKVWLKLGINNLKPIDAIPIEFIQKRIDFLHDLAEYEAEANGGYIGRSYMAKYELSELIDDWKKEQEKQNGNFE